MLGIKLILPSFFDKSGIDIGYRAVEYVTVPENLEVKIVDSVWKYELSEDRTYVIEGTEKIKVGKRLYRWSEDGKFYKGVVK